MAQASGGRIEPYGNPINDALKDPATSLEDLTPLRDSARSRLEEQGDLAGALERLEAEISRRGGTRY